MKKALVFVISCLFVFSGGSLAYAENAGSLNTPVKKEAKSYKKNVIKNAAKYIKFKNRLDLSASQIAALEQIQFNFHETAVAVKREIKVASMDYSRSYRGKGGVIDFNNARAKAKETSVVSLKLKNLKIDAYEKSYNILTMEQKTEYAKIRQKSSKKQKSKKMKKKVVKKKKNKQY